MKLKLLSMLFVFLPAIYCSAQVELRGNVTDEKTGDPLTGVNVIILDTGLGAATDIDGNYILTLPPNAKTLQFSYTGYQTKEITGITVNENEVKELSVNLSSSSVGLYSSSSSSPS